MLAKVNIYYKLAFRRLFDVVYAILPCWLDYWNRITIFRAILRYAYPIFRKYIVIK